MNLRIVAVINIHAAGSGLLGPMTLSAMTWQEVRKSVRRAKEEEHLPQIVELRSYAPARLRDRLTRVGYPDQP